MTWFLVNLPDLIAWATIAAAAGGTFVIGYSTYQREIDRRKQIESERESLWERASVRRAELEKSMAEADRRLSEQMQDFNAPCPALAQSVPLPQPAAAVSHDSGEAIRLNVAEVFSRYDRVLWAEHLIMQLPGQHQDRNAWLLNYGRTPEAHALRVHYNVAFDENTKSARLN